MYRHPVYIVQYPEHIPAQYYLAKPNQLSRNNNANHHSHHNPHHNSHHHYYPEYQMPRQYIQHQNNKIIRRPESEQEYNVRQPLQNYESGHTRLDRKMDRELYGNDEIINSQENQYSKYNLTNMRNAELLKSKEQNNIFVPKLNKRPHELLNDVYRNTRKKNRIPEERDYDLSYAPLSEYGNNDNEIKKNFNEMIPNLKSINYEKISQNKKNNQKGTKFASVQDNLL